MTQKEVTELFTLMLLAWPYDEKFKGGMQKLEATIEIWTTCLTDVDYWTGKQALIRLCKVCKFPPTIAEFREQVEGVNNSIKERTSLEWSFIRLELDMGKTPRQVFDELHPESLSRLAMISMGGPEKIFLDCGLFNYYGFEEAIRNAIISQSALPGSNHQRVGSGSRQTAALPNGNR